ncbi:C_GCAxxG_C_C family protein [Planctomycetales bacterium ZRK34]|nr:C_GCAxxG_C_C family protein [Planctomycetales bacterium ZRK34]
MSNRSRRELFRLGAACAGGAAMSTAAFGAANLPTSSAKNMPVWAWHKLSPDKTAELAYTHYPNGGCAYGMTAAVVGQLADLHGDPYDTFPIAMMRYGHSGAGGWGTLCGAANGAAAMCGLFVADAKHRDAMISELFEWYQSTTLPMYEPPDNKYPDMPASKAHSVLCHVSLANWCFKADQPVASPMRTDRCRRLTADLAAQLVYLLNKYEPTAGAKFEHSTATASCLECHSKKDPENGVSSQMSCTPCHDMPSGHPD